MWSPPRNVSLAKFLEPWKLQHQIPFKHIFWSNYHLSNLFWKFWRQANLFSNEKVNIWTPSGYFSFLSHFSVEMKQPRNLQQKKTGERWKIVKPITLHRNFHYKCRTAILKNASWWLLLRATLFWKYSWMAAFQGQLQSIFILKILDYKYFTFLTLTSC